MTVQEFIAKHNLAIAFTPYTPDASEMKRWTENHRHYKVSIGRAGAGVLSGPNGHGRDTGKTVAVPSKCFETEYHCPEDKKLRMPDERVRAAAVAALLANVLDCLAGDCRTARDHDTWEEMAGEFLGDIMKAPYGEVIEHKRIYEACEMQAKKLRRFLGEDAFRELLEDVEPRGR